MLNEHEEQFLSALICPLCKGKGLLNDNDITVACPCTGQATEDVIQKLSKNKPEELGIAFFIKIKNDK